MHCRPTPPMRFTPRPCRCCSYWSFAWWHQRQPAWAFMLENDTSKVSMFKANLEYHLRYGRSVSYQHSSRRSPIPKRGGEVKTNPNLGAYCDIVPQQTIAEKWG
ncbi:hypothetical protein BDV09DRAFT_178866 [Aspergillus tetrazonus]